jgi:hypothetical protein
MSYINEHTPWKPGVLVMEDPLDQIISCTFGKTKIIPRGVGIACALADSALVRCFIEASTVAQDAKDLNKSSTLNECYEELFEENEHITEYLDELYKIGKLLNDRIDKRRRIAKIRDEG